MLKMTLSAAKPIIKEFIMLKIPVMLHGSPGIGKSSIHQQIVKELSDETGDQWGYVCYRASTRDQVSTMGTPKIDGETTTWRVPDEFPQEARDGKCGLLDLDELNHADRQTMKALMGLINDRWLGSYTVPENWSIVASGNLASDRSGVVPLLMSLANRLAHIEIIPDVESTVLHAISCQWHPAVIGFLGFRGEELLHKMGDDYAYPTPRLWEKVSNICKGNRPDAVRRGMIHALVGDHASMEFEAFYQTYKDLPSLNGCLMDPTAAKVPQTASGLYAVTFGLIHKVNDQNFANAVTYMKRLGRTYEAWFMNSIHRHNNALTHTPEYTSWALDPENQKLVSVAA